MVKTIATLCTILLVFLGSACTGSTMKQQRLQVVDAETGVPVADARIDLHYFPSLPDAPDPDHPQATANAQGELTIQHTDRPAIWQVRADGYIEQRLTGDQGMLPPRYAAHATDQYDGIVHLYQMPEPLLNVLVDNQYTGPLIIQLTPAAGFGFVPVDAINVAFAAVDPQASYIQDVAGTRTFTATASSAGQVDLAVTPLLYDIEDQHIQVRDGSDVLPHRDIANPNDTGRGVWGSVNTDDKQVHHQIRLFVGTLAEYRAAQAP